MHAIPRKNHITFKQLDEERTRLSAKNKLRIKKAMLPTLTTERRLASQLEREFTSYQEANDAMLAAPDRAYPKRVENQLQNSQHLKEDP